MSSENVVTLTDATFEAEVLKSPMPVLVDFWAEWCGPCRMISPLVDQLADEYAGTFKVGKLDVDGCRQTPVQFGITSIPALLIFKGGELVGKIVGGNKGKMDIKAEMDKALG